MAPISTQGILLLLFLLQVKHGICDGPLQTRWMLAEKGIYGKSGGLAHAGLHGIGSLLCLLLMGVGALPSILLAAADGAVHYHVDFAKFRLVQSQGWTYSNSTYWWAMTGDQAFHQFTYLAMAAAVVMWSST